MPPHAKARLFIATVFLVSMIASACYRGTYVGPNTVWDRLAECESGGDWHINTGNGFYGGLQYLNSTWREDGGARFAPRADLATRQDQIVVATRTRNRAGGYSPWPACARELGLPR